MCISAADGNWLHPPTKQSMDDAMELLSFVGLESKREEVAGSLSFGQQKLLELVMALISRPQMKLIAKRDYYLLRLPILPHCPHLLRVMNF